MKELLQAWADLPSPPVGRPTFFSTFQLPGFRTRTVKMDHHLENVISTMGKCLQGQSLLYFRPSCCQQNSQSFSLLSCDSRCFELGSEHEPTLRICDDPRTHKNWLQIQVASSCLHGRCRHECLRFPMEIVGVRNRALTKERKSLRKASSFFSHFEAASMSLFCSHLGSYCQQSPGCWCLETILE